MNFKPIMICLLGAASIAHAQNDAPEDVIKKIYRLSVDVFDRGIYGNKYDRNRHCELYKSFFSDELIYSEKPGGSCEIVSRSNNVRYPNTDIGERAYQPEMPTHHALGPVVGPDGEVAVPVVVGDDSRVLYFLKKIGGRYRIVNLVISTKWPRDPNSEDKSERCPFSFSLSPEHDSFQISMIPKDCQQGLWLP